jgi:hypothetical protein
MTHRSKLCGAGVLALLSVLSAGVPAAQAGWGVGISLGGPCYPRHCYGPRVYGYYAPYAPVYVRPAPIVLAPAPVIVQQAPVVVPAAAPAPAYVAPQLTPVPATSRAPGDAAREEDVARYQQQLQHPEPRERAEAAVQLGRLQAPGALTSLTATLNNDRSPLVREAAARGLGLLGSPDALDALQRVAGSDEDRDVRRSSGYAADVIRSNLTRR